MFGSREEKMTRHGALQGLDTLPHVRPLFILLAAALIAPVFFFVHDSPPAEAQQEYVFHHPTVDMYAGFA